jgi:hypothetical protein
MRIDSSGYIQMGAPISTHIGTSQLFVNRGVNAAAATSGTTQTGGALRLRGGNNAVLDMGMNSVNTWIQATDRLNLANGYPLSLNPNGGNVGIGTPAPGRPLDVGSSGAGAVAGFRGGNNNQVNISHSSNGSWGLLLSNSNSSDNTNYHYSTSGNNSSVAIINVNNDALHLGTNNAARLTIDHNGNTSIGTHAGATAPIVMHNAATTVSVRGPIASGYSSGTYANGPRNTRDWFVYAGPTTNSGQYVHMKTDLWAGGSPYGNVEYTMSSFRYHNYYAYGGQTTPGGYVGWHNWSGSLLNNPQLVNEGTLDLVQPGYVSSDGYVVLVAKIGAAYAQFSIDWFQWAGYPFRARKVIAVSQSSSATGAY